MASLNAPIPVSVFLAQISASRSPGVLSGVFSRCGRRSDLRVELMAMSSSLAWKSQARAAVAEDSLQRDALTATIRVDSTCRGCPQPRQCEETCDDQAHLLSCPVTIHNPSHNAYVMII